MPGAARRLAAILAADVVGYSRLTGADEEGTLTRLRALRSEFLDPAISEHRGRVVKRTGDGILIEFASVVDAVRCALAVQSGMADRNHAESPERRIDFRVGIHLGDVVVEEDGDLMGDGVNVAARLEGIAQPGGVLISEDAWHQVRGKIGAQFSELGEKRLKNIARPVRTLAVEIDDGRASRGGRALRRVALAAGMVAILLLAGAAWYFRGNMAASLTPNREHPPLPSQRLSLVVLPLANVGGDAAQDYLADVLTAELTASLARIPDSFVIARRTAFSYKGKAIDAKVIGKELGVRYLLEGSVQPTSSRVRVNAQLIEAETSAGLWADQFDADRADLLQMQDEIVTRLARTLHVQLTAGEAARLERTHGAIAGADDLAMRCWATALRLGDYVINADAIALCESALAADSRNVRAMVILANWLVTQYVSAQLTEGDADLRRAGELASRALAIAPEDSQAHLANASVLAVQKRIPEAIVEEERSLELDPSNVDAYLRLSSAGLQLGDPDKALDWANKALRLSPRDSEIAQIYFAKGVAYFLAGKDDLAVEWIRRAVLVNPNWPLRQVYLIGALALSGHEAEARDEFTRYLAMTNNRTATIARMKMRTISDNPRYIAFRERLYEGLRRAGMPEE
ncbi:MAG: adenylate/guanylate cyclase [Rhodospirillales bacterium]|nr:adenylate/guanylate cyclase [Rhodospirillales bacterium]